MFFVCSGNSKNLKHFDLRGKEAVMNEQAIIMEQHQDLMRLARDPRRISETTYQDLSQVDIGSGFRKEFADQRLACRRRKTS